MSEQARSREYRSVLAVREAYRADAEVIERITYEATRDAYPRFVEGVAPETIDQMYRKRDLSQKGAINKYRQEIVGAPDTQHWLVAGYSGGVRGYIHVDEDAEGSGKRYVTSLYVDPEAQGQGIGGLLLRDGLHLLEAERNEVYLRVVETNEPAISLYEKFGFEFFRHVPDAEYAGARLPNGDSFKEIEMLRPAGPLE